MDFIEKREVNDIEKQKMIFSKEKKSSSTIVLWIVTISAVVITLFFVLVNIFFIIPKNSFGEKEFIAELLSAALAIIGLAVSVWAGLNIVNAIEKKDIENLQKEFDDFTLELEEGINKFDKQIQYITEDLYSHTEPILLTLEERNNKQLFLFEKDFFNEMYSTMGDLSTKVLIEKFRTIDDDIKIDFASLIEVERRFKSVYFLHNATNSYNQALLDEAKAGIELCERLLIDENLNVVVHNYLAYRIAEFKFYMGYCCLHSEREKNFLDAVKTYIEISEFFGAQLPVYENIDLFTDGVNIKYKKCDSEIAVVSAYFCNSIGEAYSKIIQVKDYILATEEKINEYGQKALFYCFYATKLHGRETYYRNYGCAIERHYGVSDKTFNKLRETYSSALVIEPKFNCFYVLLSLYDKYFNQHLGIKSVSPDNERELKLDNHFYQNVWSALEQEKKDLLLNLLSDLNKKSSVAATMYPDKPLGYTYSCIYNRDMCIINKFDIQKSNEYYLEGLKYLEVLEVVAPNAPLTKIIRRDFNNLAQFFK